MTGRIIHLMGKKYSYELLKVLSDRNNLRFKDFHKACPIEKMRTQRLKELEEKYLIKSSVVKLGRRPILVYSISDKGKQVLELLDKLERI